MKYSIFISYRHDSGFGTAKMIQEKLKSLGYKVFLDYEELRSGKFNEQLYAKIEECKDFILICSPNCFEQCKNTDDWLRLEVTHALKHNKNIVPITLRNFEWPKQMPIGMEELSLRQGVSASEELFDAFVKKLQSFLQSKPKVLIKYKSVFLATSIIAILACFSLFYFIHKQNRKQLEQVSNTIISDACLKLTTLNNELYNKNTVIEKWGKFYHATLNDGDFEYDSEKQLLLQYMQRYQSKLQEYPTTNILTDDMTQIICKSKVPLEDVQALYEFAFPNCISNMEGFYKYVAHFVKSPPTGWFNNLNKSIELNGAMVEYGYYLLYYGILAILADMPESAHNVFNKMFSNLTEFPDVGKITKEEANRLEEKYLTLLENAVMEFSELSGQAQQNMEIFENEIKNLELKREQLTLKQENISLKEEQAAHLQQQLNVKKAELAQSYEKLKVKCKPLPEDDEWMVWGKMLRLLSVNLKVEALANLAYFEKMNQDKGVNISLYSASSRKFIEDELLKNYNGGVVVFAFQDDREHSCLSVGDIIVSVNDKEIIDSDDFSKYRKAFGASNSQMKVLRLTGNHFETLILKSVEGDPLIGVSSLMEKLD